MMKGILATFNFLMKNVKTDVTVIKLPAEIISPLKDKTINKGENAAFDSKLSKGDALATNHILFQDCEQ